MSESGRVNPDLWHLENAFNEEMRLKRATTALLWDIESTFEMDAIDPGYKILLAVMVYLGDPEWFKKVHGPSTVAAYLDGRL